MRAVNRQPWFPREGLVEMVLALINGHLEHNDVVIALSLSVSLLLVCVAIVVLIVPLVLEVVVLVVFVDNSFLFWGALSHPQRRPRVPRARDVDTPPRCAPTPLPDKPPSGTSTGRGLAAPAAQRALGLSS